MAAEREAPTATDYVVTALSPVLVMLMVGSLVFFLVEVLYAGLYSDRLLYTFFFFVVGAVFSAVTVEMAPTGAMVEGTWVDSTRPPATASPRESPCGISAVDTRTGTGCC